MDAATFDLFFDDTAKRHCLVCKASLSQIAPEDLIEVSSGLVCAECFSKPLVRNALAKFDKLAGPSARVQ